MVLTSLNSHINQTGLRPSQNSLTAAMNSHSCSHLVITADTAEAFPERHVENTATGVFLCKELLLWVLPDAGESVFKWQVNTCLLKQKALKY